MYFKINAHGGHCKYIILLDGSFLGPIYVLFTYSLRFNYNIYVRLFKKMVYASKKVQNKRLQQAPYEVVRKRIASFWL